jgi:hypothetical protein
VCPANTAICSTHVVTCEYALFFQTADNYNLCQRNLLLHYRTPVLQRHGSLWVYHFPERQQVTLRRWRNDAWTSSSEILFGSAVFHNASKRSLTADGFQTLSELLGDTQATLDATRMYVPDKIAVIASHELQTLGEMLPAEIGRLDEIQPHQVVDVNSPLHVSRASKRREQQSHWHLIILTILCVSNILGFICYYRRSCLYEKTLNCQTQNNTTTQDTTEPNPALSISSTSHDANEPKNDEFKRNVTFKAYSLRQAD